MARNPEAAGLNFKDEQPDEPTVDEKLDDLREHALEACQDAEQLRDECTEMRAIADRLDENRQALDGKDEDDPAAETLEADIRADDEMLRQKMRAVRELSLRQQARDESGRLLDGFADDAPQQLDDLVNRTQNNATEVESYKDIYASAGLDLVGEPVNHPQAVWGSNFPQKAEFPELSAAMMDQTEQYIALKDDPEARKEIVRRTLDLLTLRSDDTISEQTNRWHQQTGQPDHTVSYFNNLRDPIHRYDGIAAERASAAV